MEKLYEITEFIYDKNDVAKDPEHIYVSNVYFPATPRIGEWIYFDEGEDPCVVTKVIYIPNSKSINIHVSNLI